MKRFWVFALCVFSLFGTVVYPLVHVLTKRQLCDLELIMNGGFAPLAGFMNEDDYGGVVEEMRLADGTLWPMPIILDVDDVTAGKIAQDRNLELRTAEGILIATMTVQDIYHPDKLKEVQKVYGTTNPEHPGVDYVLNQTKEYYVGGPVELVSVPKYYDFTELRKTPAELKAYFKERNIDKVVAFQTRNPMHRAHQELTFRAAKQIGGHLLIHPSVGLTKPGDIDHFTRVRCYKKLIKHYPAGTASLSLLPLSMRMGGPREALWHAIIRKNYGATHFIVGRDHAGPGKDSSGKDFYGPYDSQNLVQQYAHEIGVTVVPFKEMVYVPVEDTYYPVDEVAEGVETWTISGTQLRRKLQRGEEIPSWFSFPEVVEELQKSYPPRHKQGITIFFTGLSGSGKSTLANVLAIKLIELQSRTVSILDGDIVRNQLCNKLGFSKEDRSLNVRSIGYLSHKISESGGIAVCAFIAPYQADRDYNRALIAPKAGYIEVHVNTPLDTCEARDVKGLYAKARAGLIPNFTGISDPYEAPVNPELTIDTSKVSIDEGLEIILNYLKSEGYLN